MIKLNNSKNPKLTTKISKSYKARVEKYNFGQYAEKYAMIFLWLKGYKILKYRFKSHLGEIDIIAFKNNQIIFVEVKARYKNYNIESIIANKQIYRIKNCAKYYISKNKKLQKYKIRYDFIEVKPFFWFLFKANHRVNFLS